jgi:hypothetical protein
VMTAAPARAVARTSDDVAGQVARWPDVERSDAG